MKPVKTLLLMVLLGAAPAWGAHGNLSSNARENWVNASLDRLVAEGLIAAPAKPVGELTNLEVVQLTAKAGETLLAQADMTLPALPGDLPLPEPSLPPAVPNAAPAGTGLPSPAATKNISQLVQEFREELTAMGADLPQLEDRIWAIQHRNDSMAELQQRFLRRTGTEVGGFSRGYFHNFRGFGLNAVYPAMAYNAAIFTDMYLKSIPVPFVLFDARVRFWKTIGLYYADPIVPRIDLRWISLTNFNEYCTLTAGDFYKHYTPLTLWNTEVPAFTFVEPTSYKRNRKDVEEIVFMDHGSDWRLRGFQASTSVAWPDSDVLSLFKAQVMAGPLKAATQFKYGSYLGGAQTSFSFLNSNVEFQGTGLLILDDTQSASQPYLPDFPLTWAKQYQIGSLSTRINVPFADEVSVSGSAEYAATSFQDDTRVPAWDIFFGGADPGRVFEDWALIGSGSLNISGFHLTGKYFNVGPNFYSPGAQTNRFTPGAGSSVYFSNNNFGTEDFLPGYLNRYPIQGAGRPSFAVFDRMNENVFPYGDATPNRLGVVAGMSADIGKDGWLKPQASYLVPMGTLQMREVQPNYVLNPAGLGGWPVDSTVNTSVARVFGGFEAAVTAELAKAFDQKGKTYKIAFDYKNQTTNLGGGLPLFEVNTLIGAVDFTVPIKGFDTIVLSGAYGRVQASGNEYTLIGSGSPPTYANYAFYMDTASLGTYAYVPLNIVRTSWAMGFLYPLSKDITFRGDYFINELVWSDTPTYERREQIWRFTYEAHF